MHDGAMALLTNLKQRRNKLYGNYEHHGCKGGRGMHRGEGFGFGQGFGEFFEEEDFPHS